MNYPQVKELGYLLSMSEGMTHETDSGEEAAEPEGKALNQSISVPTLNHGHFLWVVTSRMRRWKEAAQTSSKVSFHPTRRRQQDRPRTQ